MSAIAYTLKADSELAPMITSLEVGTPEVAINRQPAIVNKPPVTGHTSTQSMYTQGGLRRMGTDLARMRRSKIADGLPLSVEEPQATIPGEVRIGKPFIKQRTHSSLERFAKADRVLV
jgi:hypothetical protein